MKCVKCSADLPDNALFCYICGAKQDKDNNVETQINAIEAKLDITGCKFSQKGRIDCGEWIRRFGFEEICLAVDIALEKYLEFDEDDKPIQSSVNEVFDKIPGICYNRKMSKETPYLADAQKMIHYAKKKFNYSEYREKELKNYIERILQLFSKKENYTENFENLFWELKRSDDKWDFLNLLEEIVNTLEESQN